MRVAGSDSNADFDSAAPMTMPAKHLARALFKCKPTASVPASLSTHVVNMAVSFRVFRSKLIPVMFLVIAYRSIGCINLDDF
jgi:hypothetical protein